MTTQPMQTQTAAQLVQQAQYVLSQAERSGSFNRETEARVNSILKMAELARALEGNTRDRFGQPSSPADFAASAFRQHLRRVIDPATVDFFCGRNSDEPVISVSGGRIERLSNALVNGRARGAITLLRDFSSVLAPENRTYAGLTTATGGADGGNMIPIGFIPTVFAAMKRTDQVLEAANWETAATADGRPTNLPSLTDTTTSAIKIAEADAQTFANTLFGNIAWPEATTWSSQVIKASIQLDVDAGVKLAGVLADAFRIRFARGFGADCVNTLLGDAPVGATTASPTAITQKDLLELVKSVDPAYAAADTSGWAMNWNTLLYIFENVVTTASTGGDALYHARKDDRGHYLLLEKPVYISPSLNDIGASNKCVLFGDWSRFLIRHVPTEAVIRRYDELFMGNFQRGYEMLFRADAKIMHAGGSGDDPLKILQCHS
jgi:HK97 family phage major capsid protein